MLRLVETLFRKRLTFNVFIACFKNIEKIVTFLDTLTTRLKIKLFQDIVFF